MATYLVMNLSLGVLDGGNNNRLGGASTESVGEDDVLGWGWSWLDEILRLLWDDSLGNLNNDWSSCGVADDRASDRLDVSQWANNGGQVDSLGDNLSSASGGVLSAVEEGAGKGGLNGQGGEWSLSSGSQCWGSSGGLVDIAAVVEALAMTVWVVGGGGKSREEEGGSCLILHGGGLVR